MTGILFDLDGVIADTSIYHFAAWRQLISKHFGESLPNELEEKTKGVSREMSLKLILQSIKRDVSVQEFQDLATEKNQIYLKLLEAVNETNILPGIMPFLKACKIHNVKMALASSSKNGEFILKKLGIEDQFDAIVDPSCICKGKPAPDIFLEGAKALKLATKECLGIEDSVAGVKALNQANIFSVAIGTEKLAQADYRVRESILLDFDKVMSAFLKSN
jgi:beta-phosphoglucomutase